MANALCKRDGHTWGKIICIKGFFKNDSYIPDDPDYYERTCMVCGCVETSDKPFEEGEDNVNKTKG